MAIQVIREPGIGENLGSSIGRGLNQGLQQLAQQKLQQVQQRHQQAQYQDALRKLAPNLPPQLIEGLSALPPKQQELALQNLGSLLSGQGQQQQPQGEFSGLSNENNGPQNNNQNVANLFQNPQDKRAQNKLDQQKDIANKAEKDRDRKFNQHEREFAYNAVKPDLEASRKKLDRLDKDIKAYKVSRELNRTGKLIQGKHHQLLKKIHLENFFTNPETELFQKQQASLITGANTAFNSNKMTNFSLQSYEKTLGSLMNTQEGYEAVAKNKVLELKADAAKERAFIQLTRKYINEGKPIPLDARDQAAEIAQPEVKKYADKALENIAKAQEDLAKNSKRAKPGATFEDLPPNDPSQFNENDVLDDPETGKVVAVFKNGKWKRKGAK